jgi:hypothetical protein
MLPWFSQVLYNEYGRTLDGFEKDIESVQVGLAAAPLDVIPAEQHISYNVNQHVWYNVPAALMQCLDMVTPGSRKIPGQIPDSLGGFFANPCCASAASQELDTELRKLKEDLEQLAKEE